MYIYIYILKELIGIYIIYDSRSRGSAIQLFFFLIIKYIIYFKHILKYEWVGSGLTGL